MNFDENKIETNIGIRKMGNIFWNVQQMLAQLAIYIVLSFPLYHATRTFKFINTSPLQECAFALKVVKSLKALPSNSTNIMCPSIIDKYIKRLNFSFNVSFIEFVIDHDMVNVNKERHKSHIICYVHYNEHRDPKTFYNEQLLLFIPFFIMRILLKATIPHIIMHTPCMNF
jgi:hypothetical protein